VPTPASADALFAARATTPAVEIWPGVYRRTIVWGERAMVCEVTLPKGTSVPPHSHVHEQCGYLVSGRLEFTIAGEARIIEPGGGWAVPSNAVHSVVALDDAIALDVFSPVREEYK
jgi:quercetin dioxygenase-like cupin family protein